jgi:hypothetical protein
MHLDISCELKPLRCCLPHPGDAVVTPTLRPAVRLPPARPPLPPPEGPAGTRLAPRTPAAGPSLAGSVVSGAAERRAAAPPTVVTAVGWGLFRLPGGRIQPSPRRIYGLRTFSSSSPPPSGSLCGDRAATSVVAGGLPALAPA